MTGKRLYIILLLSLVLFVNGCGDTVPPDAVILPITPDETLTIGGSTGGTLVKGPIQFKVQVTATDTTPIADAPVTLTGSSPILSDPISGFLASSNSPNFLNPANPNFVTMNTNSVGVVTVYYQFSVPPCTTTDLDLAATVSATIGVSSVFWQDDITISAC